MSTLGAQKIAARNIVFTLRRYQFSGQISCVQHLGSILVKGRSAMHLALAPGVMALVPLSIATSSSVKKLECTIEK